MYIKDFCSHFYQINATLYDPNFKYKNVPLTIPETKTFESFFCILEFTVENCKVFFFITTHKL